MKYSVTLTKDELEYLKDTVERNVEDLNRLFTNMNSGKENSMFLPILRGIEITNGLMVALNDAKEVNNG